MKKKFKKTNICPICGTFIDSFDECELGCNPVDRLFMAGYYVDYLENYDENNNELDILDLKNLLCNSNNNLLNVEEFINEILDECYEKLKYSNNKI